MEYQPSANADSSGWNNTFMGALADCMLNIQKFEYRGPEWADPAGA